MNYQYLNSDQLVDLIRQGRPGQDYQVVDVRDDDYRGGNIPGAIRAPTEQRTDQSVTDLVQQLKDVPNVIFHCTLSQVRGPKAARIYADALTAAHSAPDAAPVPSETAQRVYVLRDGFGGWQALHKNDPALVENFDPTIWSEPTL